MDKIRPAVVISSDAVGILPVKLVVPITEWKGYFKNNIWHVRVEPDQFNGLTKTGAMDAMQIRVADRSRFVNKLGQLSASVLENVVAAVAAVIEYS